MTICNLSPLRLPKIHDEPLLMLRCDYFHDSAERVLQSVLPTKAAKDSSVIVSNLLAVRLPRMHDPILLTLLWHSFSRWDRERVCIIFACKCGQYLNYVWPQLNQFRITRLTWAKVDEAVMMFIFSRVDPQYAIIWFGVVHHWHCFGSLSTVFVCFHIDHYVVL